MANNYEFYKRFKDVDETIQNLTKKIKCNYKTKYYNLWMSKFEWNGLDEENKEQQQNYIMKQLWKEGKAAFRNIPNTDLLVICPFTEEQFNIYDYPDTVTLINTRGVSTSIIPAAAQTVNKQVALLYCTPGKDSIQSIADYYIDRIVQVELLINNNLKLQNMPFVIGVEETDKDKFEDIVTRILNNEIVIFSSVGDISRLQTLVTETPYLIDKLKAYEVSLENEFLTMLGVDNSGVSAKKAQMLVDEVNANNDVINDYGRAIEDEMKLWIARINKVLNRNISIKAKSKPVDQTSDYEDAAVTSQKEESILKKEEEV